MSKKLSRQEILERVKEREFKKRCVDAAICPECGGNLSQKDDGHLIDHVCVPCNLSFPYV